MFPSSNNDNPFDFLLKRPCFLIDQNPSIFKQDDPPFFLNFSSPFFDEHELPLNQILSHDQTQIMSGNINDRSHYGVDDQENYITRKEVTKPTNIIVASKSGDQKGGDGHDQQMVNPNGSTNTIVAPAVRRRNLGAIPRKRTGKKDRHSKICTAQGIRDRRMRLSLQVARKFFDLQDMLGFDKASKTIEWLFTKSKKAIKELTKDHPYISTSDAKSESFLSECEVVSSVIEEISNNNGIKEGIEVPTKPCYTKSKKTSCDNKSNIRESRDKARARARCRTREKMISKWFKSNPNNQENDHDVLKLGFSNSSPFEQGADQESTPREHQERVSQFISHFNSIGEQLSSDAGTIEKLLGNSRTPPTSCPCPIISHDTYNQCPDSVPGNCIDSNAHFMGFLGNWDLLNNDRSMTSSQFVAMTNQDLLAGNSNPTYSVATPNFPLFHQ